MEKIRASLFNSSDLIGLSSLDGEDELMELSSEEILTASTVNQSLFDTQGSSALEDYFLDKSLRGWWFNSIYSGCQRVPGHSSLLIQSSINFGRRSTSCPRSISDTRDLLVFPPHIEQCVKPHFSLL